MGIKLPLINDWNVLKNSTKIPEIFKYYLDIVHTFCLSKSSILSISLILKWTKFFISPTVNEWVKSFIKVNRLLHFQVCYFYLRDLLRRTNVRPFSLQDIWGVASTYWTPYGSSYSLPKYSKFGKTDHDWWNPLLSHLNLRAWATCFNLLFVILILAGLCFSILTMTHFLPNRIPNSLSDFNDIFWMCRPWQNKPHKTISET